MVQLVGGNVVFTPNANFNGAASFTYTVQDNGLTAGVADPKTASAKASFTITRVNDAPIANDDVLTSVGEDSGARTISAATLLANDARGPANESGQILKITGVSDAVGGTVDLVNGNVVFTPAAHFNGTASFTYTVQDNGLTAGVSDPKTSTATVAFEVNDAPVAAAVAASGRDNSRSIPITLSATDPNTGDTIESFTLKSLSANGTIYLDAALTQTVSADTAYAATGNQLQLFFDPAPDFVGTTSFSYVASDGHANSGTASASITTIDGFDIDFRYTGDESLRHFFTAAAARWEEIITADLPDINASSIGLGIIDDLNIAATIEFIDGVSGILGSAGPEYVRNSNSLPLTGIMRFDSADVANLVAAGQFDEVILHEMGHVLGIGTIWNRFAGLIDVAKLNYFGANALAEYRKLKGDQTLTSIPLEDGGGGGTAGSHGRRTSSTMSC
jgi:hypothetical protein